MAIERIVPGTKEWEAYYSNHIVRYQFAIENIKSPKRVLDAACGVGYGAKHLADALAVPIVGVDISDEALQVALEKFTAPNISYKKDDCEKLSLLEGKFSHVVSFETFEHLKRPMDFLGRVYSLLDTDGVLLLSTPNASVSSPDRNVKWEYHETEYIASEFLEMVRAAGFKNIQLYGERYTSMGVLRNDLRKELHRLHHNPFIRLGKWIQKMLRGVNIDYAVLPERNQDFEFVSYPDPESCEKEGISGPIVLLVVCKK